MSEKADIRIVDAGGYAWMIKDGKPYVCQNGTFVEVEVQRAQVPTPQLGGGDDPK